VGTTTAPFEILISGNQAVRYLYGGARRANSIRGSTASSDKFVIDIAQAGQAFVTLYRTGPHTALYEFTIPNGGVRVTGNAFRR